MKRVLSYVVGALKNNVHSTCVPAHFCVTSAEHGTKRQSVSGMSLVEVVVAAAVIAMVFGGLMVAFQLMISLIGVAKAETGALALANERIEYIRSLPYDDVGTVGGIPDGPIAQNTTRILNGVTYNERVLISYVDAPEDGSGALDENGIVADYKLVKIEYTWEQKGQARSRELISNIVPRGIETTAGGGTLRVNVFDASVQPVEGAEVRVYNNTGTSTIDTIRYTNASGVALFAGAPALASYELTVTKDGYSTDATYSASPENPSPTPPHVAVLEGEVSTMNFQIDTLASLAVTTVGLPTTSTFSDDFATSNNIAAASNTVVASSSVVLTGGPDAYATSGTVTSVATTPATFTAWNAAAFTFATTTNTNLSVSVYSVTGTSTYTLVPDVDLPGNSSGFTAGTINLSSLTAASYPSLALRATLTSSDVFETPQLQSWELTYTISEPPIADVPFSVRGSKTIGTTASATPVYKYSIALSTDASGELSMTNLEWDVYTFTLDTSSYDLAEACPAVPLTLTPGANETLKLTLAAAASRSLRVTVTDVGGALLTDTSVRLYRSGYDETETTSACGQTFFNNSLPSATDYTLEVSKTGYTTETLTNVEITGTESVTVVLPTP